MSYYKRGGGYRGSRQGLGDGGGWRGRGGFSGSSRGGPSGGGQRYNSSYPSSNYDSRSRSSYSGSGDRYGRGRDDSYNHRYQGVADYSSRDYGRGMSPEPPRKRARPENSPPHMASRRSHERSFSSDYSSTRNYYDKGAGSSSSGGYMGDKPYSREVRERNSDFTFRKPAGYSTPRGGGGVIGGGFRGRGINRGLRTRGYRTSAPIFLRKRENFINKRFQRDRISRIEYIRRLKALKIRRKLRAVRRDRDLSDDDDDDEDAGDLDNEKEDDDEKEEGSSAEEEIEEEEDEEEQEVEDDNEDDEKPEMEEGAEETGDKVAKEEDKDDEKKDNEDSANAEGKPVKKKVAVKKKVIKKIKLEPKENTEDGEEGGDKEDAEDSDKPVLTDFLGQPFIKLRCPHCTYSCVTFKEYSKHLESKKHKTAMLELFSKIKKTLTAMRHEQREKQKLLDDETKSKNLRLRTFFCSICKLNYRTLKSQHKLSSSHKKMSEFLLPYCKVCHTWFKSAWSYESHLCELPHIKRTARMERLSRPPTNKDDGDNMLDPSSFMILDSVGSGDDSDVGDEEKSNEDKDKDEENNDEKEEEENDTNGKAVVKKKKKEIKLGSEFCKLIQVYYCDLCKMYLPRLDDKERALTIHCRSRTHLQRYVRHKDDTTLRRKAVKLHKERLKLREKKEKEAKEKKEGGKGDKGSEKDADKTTTEDSNEEKKETSESPVKKTNTEEEGGEVKLISELDKDLSDLLQEGGDESREEEDSKERYDRFRQSDTAEKDEGSEEVRSNGGDPASPVDKKKSASVEPGEKK